LSAAQVGHRLTFGEAVLSYPPPRELLALFLAGCAVGLGFYTGVLGAAVVAYWLWFGFWTLHLPWVILRIGRDRRGAGPNG
jgi:hypothetical protein